ncbi:MAG: 3-hydroxyacyl-CoA dehydrogenase NAD-binding domain-containing protein [Rhodospirillales bacterium]
MALKKTVRRVAVLGVGVMGSQIAAHFANAGIPVLLLDVALPDEEQRSAAALRGIEWAASRRPGAFFTPDAASLVTPGNFEDDLRALGGCDWIIEAVVENLEIKRALIEKAACFRRPDAIFSTNTSGIPLAEIAKGFPPELGRAFLGTHFFNPPRYLHLLELVSGPETDPEVIEFVASFAEIRLGKGVVRAKDTPNFIANRIGSFFSATVLKLMVEGGYSVEEVDALTGPLIGFPKSASLRLADIIGLDTWACIAQNLCRLAPEDPWRERFQLPDFVARMIERGWLGEKTGQGFYRRAGAEREIQAIDWRTLEYHPAEKPVFPSLDATRYVRDLAERLRTVIAADDRAGTFLWRALSDLFLYTAGLVPEVSNRIVEIDRAMRWGYGHKLGPFELWDALGAEQTVERMRSDGRTIPEGIEALLDSGAKSFYRPADQNGEPRTEYFDFGRTRFETLEDRPGVLVLSDLKRARGVVGGNHGASLIDLGDGVLCLEFHDRRGVLGGDQIDMILAGIEETNRNFEAMVIAGQASEGFCAGEDLALILMYAQEGEWDELDAAARRVQDANMAIKYAARPIVAAPFGFTTGSGCEVALHAARIQASAELYMGLTEVSAGLIPAGGGCKEMLIRLGDPQRVMELIASAKVSTSAADARRLGLLRATDAVSMNPERLIAEAKAAALALAPLWTPGTPNCEIRVTGDPGYAAMQLKAWLSYKGNHISETGLDIAGKLAYVLSGGRLSGPQNVPEQYLLDLEREAFLSLCGEPRTQQRIEHLLAAGKPLRN